MKHLLYSALAIILLGVSIPMTIKAGNPDSTVTKKTSYTPRKSGWYTTINVEPVAVNVADKVWAAPASLVSVSTGYQICPYIALGGGVGFRWAGYRVNYEDGGWDVDRNKFMPIIPVFLDVCVNLNNKKVTPYFPINLGYNIIVDASRYNDYYGVLIQNAKVTAFFSVGFGMKVRFHKASSWNLAGTLTAEQFKYTLKNHHDTYNMNPTFLLAAISTGFTF